MASSCSLLDRRRASPYVTGPPWWVRYQRDGETGVRILGCGGEDSVKNGPGTPVDAVQDVDIQDWRLFATAWLAAASTSCRPLRPHCVGYDADTAHSPDTRSAAARASISPAAATSSS